MTLKERFQGMLKNARGFSERLFEGFKTPQQWTHQVHPRANHPLWFAGHIGMVDNFMISMIDPSQVTEKPGYREKFSIGSRPTSNPADYPPVAEVLEFMRERRKTLLGILDKLNEEDFNKPTTKGAPGFIPDFGSVFSAAAWHEGMHSGQMSVAHRAVGNEPLVDAPPPGVKI